MNYRNLGKTGIEVSEIGLGTEFLNEQSQETVVSVIHEAIKNEINYFDTVFSFKEYLENLKHGFKGFRDKIYITGHMGSGEKDGRYKKIRGLKECEARFLNTLTSLNIDYVDIGFLQFITGKEFDNIMGSNSLYGIMKKFQKEGKVRSIGLSTHDASVGIKAAKSGKIDVIMYPINLRTHNSDAKKRLYKACIKNNIGLVAMKPFSGGKLFQQNQKASSLITPTHCLSYILSNVGGVSTIVPGVKNNAELRESLHYLKATEEEKDFSEIITQFKKYKTGECVYCNHCLPCPSKIDIGYTIKSIDLVQKKIYVEGLEKESLKSTLEKISDCTKCGSCVERCPFSVDIMLKMEDGKKILEGL